MQAFDPQKETVSISVDTSILLALVKLGTETRTPIGILLDTGRSEQLCEEHRQVKTQNMPVSEFLTRLLAQSSYVRSTEDGVIVIRPAHIADRVRSILNLKFDSFGGAQTTMQGEGMILRAWIYSRLHPEVKGYAMDILSSPDAEQFPEFKVRDASVEQILNRIVSLGDKGIWFFQLGPDFERNKGIDLHTYSYKDDARALQTLCSSDSPLKQ